MHSPHAALIVDADPQGLESLVYGFQGAAWRMTACPSPETASLLVKASGAQLIVVASRAEHERTHSLLAQLRAKEESRALPVLVLGPEELRPRLKSEGDADLLPLPAFVRDVLTASELLVATAAAHQPGEEPGWRAPVTASKIFSLVRTMNGLGRSGQLRLERNGRTGEILFHQGELTSASIGPLQGMAALQHLMVWNDGKLELRLRQVPRRGQLPTTAQDFLQEMERFQRDFAHAMKEIGPPTAVYSASQERLEQAASTVPAEVTPVLRLCSGSRSLSDIIDESPFRVLDTVRILGRLAELGVLIRSDGKPLLPPPSDERLEAKIVGPSAPDAWPMPAPIGGFPLSTPIPPEEMVTPPPVEEQVTPPPRGAIPPEEQVTPPPVNPLPPAGRPRRQTREIAIVPSPTDTPATAKTPRPVIVVGAPAEKTPRLVPTGRGAGKTPKPVVVVAPRAAAAAHGQGTPPPAEKTPSVAPRVPDAPAASSSAVMRAAGVIDSGKHARRGQKDLRAVAPRPSVVIDAIASEEMKTPMPPAGAAPPAGGSAAGPPPPAHRTTPLMGTLEVKPARRSAARAVPVVRSSIQLDASLSAPAAPAATQPAAPTVTQPEASGTRVTGELRVTPSGRTTRSADKAAQRPSSFHIDPSLSGEIPAAAKPAEPSRGGSQPAASQKRTDSRPIPRGRTDSQPIPGTSRHQSGSFSTLEKDFFDREVDLYKQEKVESFADLDEGKGKSAAKHKGGKSGRPYRK